MSAGGRPAAPTRRRTPATTRSGFSRSTRNPGPPRTRILEIDLKPGPAGAAPASKVDPTVVDPRHYKIDLENDQVRVLRVHYDPRDAGVQHEHILNRVVVYLNDQPGAKADDVRMAGAATHIEQNASDQPADRIAIEIK